MRLRNLTALLLLAVFVLPMIGCSDAPKNVVDQNQKTGLSPQERADKRGN